MDTEVWVTDVSKSQSLKCKHVLKNRQYEQNLGLRIETDNRKMIKSFPSQFAWSCLHILLSYFHFLLPLNLFLSLFCLVLSLPLIFNPVFPSSSSPLASFLFSPPSLPLFSHSSFLLLLLSSSFLLPPTFLSILLMPPIIPLQLNQIVSNSLKSKYQWLLSWMIHSESVYVHPCKNRINVWILACDQGSSRKIIA